MVSIAFSASVRSAHASMTVRACSGESRLNAPSCWLVKHTTSQRPAAGAERNGGSSTVGTVCAEFSENAGKRFSNTATS